MKNERRQVHIKIYVSLSSIKENKSQLCSRSFRGARVEYKNPFRHKIWAKIRVIGHLLTHWWQQQSNSHSDRLQPQLRDTKLECRPFQTEKRDHWSSMLQRVLKIF